MNQGQIPLTATAAGVTPSVRSETPFPMQLSDSLIPHDVLKLIPEFSGETNILSLFLRKCEYVIGKYQGTSERNEFLMQNITSKLKGKAAALLSERGDLETYSEFKSLMIQHFGDPRSEECVAIELETLKIKSNESYLDFCSRIQDIRAILISKVNQNGSATLREAKKVIYNNTSLNVFMYNLPEHMVRIVRIKNPSTLEEALQFVLEEVNFQEQYNLRSKMLQHRPQSHQSLPSSEKGAILSSNNPRPSFTAPQLQHNYYRPPTNQTQFKFGIPNQVFVRPNMPYQQIGFRPQLPQPGIKQPQQFGNTSRPQAPFGYGPQAAQFGYGPQVAQFGYRPQVGQFGFRASQPSGYRPPNNLSGDRDVTMRTAPAPVKQPQSFPINELYTNNEQYYYDPNYNDYGICYLGYCDYDYTNMYNNNDCVDQNPNAETPKAIEKVDDSHSTENKVDSKDAPNFQINLICVRPK